MIKEFRLNKRPFGKSWHWSKDDLHHQSEMVGGIAFTFQT